MYSVFLVIRGMQSKIISHARILNNSKWWQGHEERRTLYTVSGDTNYYSHFGNQPGDFPKDCESICHVTQLYQHLVYTQMTLYRNTELFILAHPCSLLLYSPSIGNGISPVVQMNGEWKCGKYTHRNFVQL